MDSEDRARVWHINSRDAQNGGSMDVSETYNGCKTMGIYLEALSVFRIAHALDVDDVCYRRYRDVEMRDVEYPSFIELHPTQFKVPIFADSGAVRILCPHHSMTGTWAHIEFNKAVAVKDYKNILPFHTKVTGVLQQESVKLITRMKMCNNTPWNSDQRMEIIETFHVLE